MHKQSFEFKIEGINQINKKSIFKVKMCLCRKIRIFEMLPMIQQKHFSRRNIYIFEMLTFIIPKLKEKLFFSCVSSTSYPGCVKQ